MAPQNNNSQRIKRLEASKQNRVGFRTGTPNERDGRDGDMYVSLVPNKGMFLFYKHANSWYGTKLSKMIERFIDEDKVIIPNKRTGFNGKNQSGELTREGDNMLFETVNSGAKKVYRQGDSTFVKTDLSLQNVTNESKTTLLDDATLTGDVTIGGGDLYGRTDYGLTLHVDTNFDVRLDENNDTDNSSLRIINGAGSVVTVAYGDGTVSCGEITAGAVTWHSWEFHINRAVGHGTAASARRYYRDVDDADDYRKWDAYFDNSATGSYVINTANLAGLFTVPEPCKIGAIYGQIAGDGGSENPTVEVWKVTPSDASNGAPVIMATDTITLGSADSNYEINPTSFTNNTLAAGDIIVPAVLHGNAASLFSYYGNLTIKFITT